MATTIYQFFVNHMPENHWFRPDSADVPLKPRICGWVNPSAQQQSVVPAKVWVTVEQYFGVGWNATARQFILIYATWSSRRWNHSGLIVGLL